MFVFFDESGDYAFPRHGFDCYVQAAVICPDSIRPAIDAFVERRKLEWGVKEMHSVDMTAEQVLEVCAFLVSTPCELLANITDNHVVTRDAILRCRLDQAATFSRNLDQHRALTGADPQFEQHLLRHVNRAGFASRIPDSEFIQAHFLVPLIADILEKAVYRFRDDRWRQDLCDFRFILDRKHPTQLSRGEKYLNAVLLFALASRSRRKPLRSPRQWHQSPEHPFMLKFRDEPIGEAGQEIGPFISLKQLFEHGLQFERSHDHAGLQVADVVAGAIRRAVLHPHDAATQAAYDLLRPKLAHRDGRLLDVRGVASGVPVPRSRYERVLYGHGGPARRPRSMLVLPRRAAR